MTVEDFFTQDANFPTTYHVYIYDAGGNPCLAPLLETYYQNLPPQVGPFYGRFFSLENNPDELSADYIRTFIYPDECGGPYPGASSILDDKTFRRRVESNFDTTTADFRKMLLVHAIEGDAVFEKPFYEAHLHFIKKVTS